MQLLTAAHLDAVCGPTAQPRCGIDVLLKLRREFRQIYVQMASQPQHRRRAGELAFGVQQFRWSEQVATIVTLVSSGILPTPSMLSIRRQAKADIGTDSFGSRPHNRILGRCQTQSGPPGTSLEPRCTAAQSPALAVDRRL